MMLWTEKYRPTRLAQIVGQESFKLDAENWVLLKDMPNLLLYGPAGTGKTTLSINNDMSNADWAGVLYQNGNATDGFDNNYAGGLESKTTGSILMTGYASSLIDAFMWDLIVMGDLA